MGEVVIVGGGHAAGQLCASLRSGGWQGGVTLIGEEPVLPYQRPPLSKAYLAGDLAADRLLVKPESFYEKNEVTLRLGERVSGIDREARRVSVGEAASVPYDHLVLATGTTPRRLDCPGADLEGVGYVRTLADVDALRQAFAGAERLVVVGAGYIGLEVAAVAAKRGLAVTVLEAGERVLGRVTGEAVSAFYQDLHRSRGVDLRLGARLEGFEGEGRVSGVRMEGGAVVPADLVVVGIGVLPQEGLAAAAGIETENGIVVDEHCVTSDPNVLAVGDCTFHPNPVYGRSVRLESVHNALEQAKTAAATICGAPKPYGQVPWFWSDQYEFKLQTVGLLTGHDAAVLRGTPEARAFAVFYLQKDRLIAVDAVNEPVAFMAAKKLVGRSFDPTALADEAVSLRDLMTA